MRSHTTHYDRKKIAHFLHIDSASLSSLKIGSKIRLGFRFDVFIDFSKELDMGQQELSKIISINERTLARRKEENKLKPVESDRLYRLINIYLIALHVFKDNKNSAIVWLKSPKTALGGEIPLNLLDTEIGAREVENLLGRIEYGVYS